MGIIYALITVIAWGTWIAPSQNVPMKHQQTRTLYVSLGVLLLALIVSSIVGFEGLNTRSFWFTFLGGLIWAISGWCAFIGTKHLGMAGAFGIWAPLNIMVSIFWGGVLFSEFRDVTFSDILFLSLGFGTILIGLLLIVSAGNGDNGKKEGNTKNTKGLLGAVGAGIGFATFFIPIQVGSAEFPKFNMWIGTLPLALGMFTGSLVLLLISRSSARLEHKSYYLRVLSTGVLWAIGNYGALAMMELLGTGKGFTIAQLCVVVNALVGVYILKQPNPRTKAAKRTLIGVVIATAGGILLGNV